MPDRRDRNGGVTMRPLSGAIANNPGSCAEPRLRIIPAIVDETAKPFGANQGGWLVVAHLWPGILRDNLVRRCAVRGSTLEQGAAPLPCRRKRPPQLTIEIESALVPHPQVAEAVVVARPDELRREAVADFATLTNGQFKEALRDELKQHDRREIGTLAQSDDTCFTRAVSDKHKITNAKILPRQSLRYW